MAVSTDQGAIYYFEQAADFDVSNVSYLCKRDIASGRETYRKIETPIFHRDDDGGRFFAVNTYLVVLQNLYPGVITHVFDQRASFHPTKQGADVLRPIKSNDLSNEYDLCTYDQFEERPNSCMCFIVADDYQGNSASAYPDDGYAVAVRIDPLTGEVTATNLPIDPSWCCFEISEKSFFQTTGRGGLMECSTHSGELLRTLFPEPQLRREDRILQVTPNPHIGKLLVTVGDGRLNHGPFPCRHMVFALEMQH